MIYALTDFISRMIHAVVVGQLVLVIFIAILTFFLLMYRLFAEARYRFYSDFYSTKIADEVSSEDIANGTGHFSIHKPGVLDYLKWSALRDTLINHIELLEGAERREVIYTYDRLGFRSKDILDCLSWRWQTRLNASSRLILLEDVRLGALFRSLTGDVNPFVQGLAYLAISKLNDPSNRPDLISKIPARLVERKNLMIGITHSLCHMHGVRVMLKLLQKDQNLERVEISLQVLANQATSEESIILIELLDQYKDISVLTTRTLIQTFLRLFEPAAIDYVRPLIFHGDATVRAAAAEYIIKVSEQGLTYDEFRNLSEDKSTSVRRALQGLPSRVAA